MRILLHSLHLGLALGAWTAPSEAEFNLFMTVLVSVVVADIVLSTVSRFVNKEK
jgi:hypothetical protein